MVLGKLPVPGRPTLWMIVGQGPIALAVGAGGGGLDIFTLLYLMSSLSPSLWETARYRLKYCLKGPLNPKQPTNQHLQSLHNRHIENPLLLKHNELAELNRIVFCWLPSHVGIKADIAAKSALTLHISGLKIPFTDFKPSINTFLHNKWQMSWNAAVFNKLHSIKPSNGNQIIKKK